MDIKYLRNYIEIVDSGSITAAAKKLFIAQPALSNQLKGLEKELGTVLLDRGPHHQRLTYSGKIFYERARHIIELEDGVKRDISKFENRQMGNLRLGITPYTATTLFDGIISDFCKENPQIKYDFYEYDSGKLIELLESRLIDAAIVRTPCRIPKSSKAYFLEEDKWIVVYSDEMTDFENDEISLRELGDTPVAMIRRHEDIFVKACEDADYMPNIQYLTVQLSTVFDIAKNGLAVGIVPFTSYEFIKNRGLKFKPVKNNLFSIGRAIVTSKDGEMSFICGDFIEFCKDRLKI